MTSGDIGRRAVIAAGAIALPAISAQRGASAPQGVPAGRGVSAVANREELAALATVDGTLVWLDEGDRAGWFSWRDGDHRASVRSDPQQGLFVPASLDPIGARGCWIRNWDGVIGCPEWFGAVPSNPDADCLGALRACVALCQTIRLGPHDYYIRDTWQLGTSGRNLIGSAGSGSTVGYGVDEAYPMGTADGTRLILTGPRVTDATVFVFGGNSGARDDLSIMRNSHLAHIKFARDCSKVRVRPSNSDDPIDAVRGIELRYFSDCTVSDVRSYDSPVGFYCHGIVYSLIRRCMARRVTPASSAKRDFWVGWLVGGYGSANFGYIGANASVYFEHCSTFDNNPAFDTSIGLKLFGRIADSFFTNFEMARQDYGVIIDGSKRSGGLTMGNAAFKYAHQDVTFTNPVLDSYTAGGFVIRNLHDYNCLDIVVPYASGGGAALDVADAAGQICVTSGKFLSGGVRVRNGNGFTLTGTLIRDAVVPLELENVGMFRLEPNIFNFETAANAGCVLTNAFRGRLAPQLRGAPGMIGYGVVMDAATNHVTIDETAIDPGCFTVVESVRKVRYAGHDAHLHSGTNRLAGTMG